MVKNCYKFHVLIEMIDWLSPNLKIFFKNIRKLVGVSKC